MASREELLNSIQPGMRLDRNFFLKVYGYEISTPGFCNIAIKALEDAGCTKAADYYADTINAYQKSRENATKGIGKRLIEEIDRNYEKMCREAQGRGEEQRRQKEIQNLTRSELTELCQKLLQEGVITSPGQFVTMV